MADTLNTSRRALLAAAPAVAVVAAVPTMAAAPSTEWDAAMRRWLDAKAACEAMEKHWRRALAAYDATKPTKPRDGFVIYQRGKSYSFEQARENAMRLRNAFEIADAEARRKTGLTEIEHALDPLAERYADAESALMELPAPHAGALRWKLDKLLAEAGDYTPSWSADFVRQTLDDYRRLLGPVS